MVERTRRARVGDRPRGGEGREWEVLVREDASAPMCHVGSVTAPSADAAHERAARLFAWTATDVWLCPADEVRRFSTHDLDDARTGSNEEGGTEANANPGAEGDDP
ncbi:MAG: Htur_1727 family rSAM-partnered candidate RiPP [Haloferacaceae archaeon]